MEAHQLGNGCSSTATGTPLAHTQEAKHPSQELLHAETAHPCTGGAVPCTGGAVPCTGGAVPCTGGAVSCTGGAVP